MKEDIAEVLLTPAQIQARIKELARIISQDYAGQEPVLVCVLKGAALFLADLMKAISIPVYIDFMAIASYGPGQTYPGAVRMLKDLDSALTGRPVILVEDIIDTGSTIDYLINILKARKPESLEVCVLLDKPSRHLVDISLKYVGFTIADLFVVGYGLDFNQRYRNLPFVCTLKPEIYRSCSLK